MVKVDGRYNTWDHLLLEWYSDTMGKTFKSSNINAPLGHNYLSLNVKCVGIELEMLNVQSIDKVLETNFCVAINCLNITQKHVTDLTRIFLSSAEKTRSLALSRSLDFIQHIFITVLNERVQDVLWYLTIWFLMSADLLSDMSFNLETWSHWSPHGN